MTAREAFLIDRIDRAREAPVHRAQRTARATFLRAKARRGVVSILSDVARPDERAAILGHLIDIAAEHRWPIIGRVETATSLNAVAADVCASLRLPGVGRREAAERAFKAANDGGSSA